MPYYIWDRYVHTSKIGSAVPIFLARVNGVLNADKLQQIAWLVRCRHNLPHLILVSTLSRLTSKRFISVFYAFIMCLSTDDAQYTKIVNGQDSERGSGVYRRVLRSRSQDIFACIIYTIQHNYFVVRVYPF